MRKYAGVLLVLVVGAMLSFGIDAGASPPFDRTLSWTQSRTDIAGNAIPATDNLVPHVYVCTSGSDNTSCTEIGVGAANATTWTGTSPQPSNSTRWYRTRVEWTQQGTTSAFSPATSFFLPGREAVPAGAPAVQ